MRRRTRYLLAFGGVVGGGVLLWTGHAFGSHGLHTCVSQAGTIRVAQSCQSLERAVVLVQEPNLFPVYERLATLESRVGAVEAENALLESRVGAVEAENAALRGRASALEAKVGALEATLAGVTRSGDTLTFSGMNVRVVNGLASTETINGLGNLFIGYNEASPGGETRTGSHNLIIGPEHTYSSFGGLVAGSDNRVVGPSASVSGGRGNTAGGEFSSVSGGSLNIASGSRSSVSGGSDNTASGGASSVSGGFFRSVSGNANWRAGKLFEDN